MVSSFFAASFFKIGNLEKRIRINTEGAVYY